MAALQQLHRRATVHLCVRDGDTPFCLENDGLCEGRVLVSADELMNGIYDKLFVRGGVSVSVSPTSVVFECGLGVC